MVRKLLIVLVSLMMMAPISAYALGFGNIKLNSALNEPLDADINLLSATPQDVAGLKVKLASHDAFANAGIDRTAVLSQLKFTVKSRANGSYYIHVTSRQPIREPYLDFLLELNWSHGRMLREYTVLLDPPNLMRKEKTAVAPATTQAPPTIARSEQPKPAPQPAPKPAPQPAAKMPVSPTAPNASAPGQAPAAQAKAETGGQKAAMPTPKPKAAPKAPEQPAAPAAPKVAQAPAPSPAPAEQDRGLMPYIPIGGGQESAPAPSESGKAITHITKKGDKLWNIAEEMRPDDVSVYQMMMALLASNPKAFVNHNVNRLKAGYVLRVQDPSLLHELSRQEAVHKFEAQTQAWEDYRQRVAGSATKQAMTTTSQNQAPAGSASGEAQGHLQLVTPSGKGSSAGSGQEGTKLKAAKDIKDLATARKQLNLAIEEAATERRKNAEMTDRLKELEKQIKDMQRLISLKNDELASLQQQLKAQGEQPATAPNASAEQGAAPAAGEQAAPEKPAAKPSAKSGAESGAEQPGQTQPTSSEAEPAPSETAPAESAAMGGQTPAAGAAATAGGQPPGNGGSEQPGNGGGGQPGPGTGTSASSQAAPPAAAPPVSSPPPHVPWWKKILNTVGGMGKMLAVSPLLMAGGAALLIVLLVLLLIVMRRRKKGYGFQESILTGEGAAEGAEAAAGAAGGAAQGGEESSFLSDFAVSGVNAIQTEDNEVDPLTEADVYMAYGRNQQAEELLTEALKNDPKRKELKVKLLELYHATKNKARFEETAEDLYADVGNDSDPTWTKVVAMGAEIAPGNPLFAGAAAPAASGGGAGMAQDDVMDIGLDTGVFQLDDLQGGEQSETAGAEPQADSGLDFDFDLGGGEASTEAAAEAAPAATPDEGGLDFNLDFTEPEQPAGGAEAPAEAASADDGGLDFSLDFDTGGDTGAPTAGAEEPATVGADEGALEFDLGGAGEDQGEEIDFDLGGLDTGGPVSEEFPAPSDTEIDIGASQADQTQAMDFNLDAGDLGGAGADLDAGGDLDEVGTKLDLAKAYIDMGDPEGARSILDEVMDEGNDSQKQEAQELMTQIV